MINNLGIGNDNGKETSEDGQHIAPLALHIRRLRQWYGDNGLTQKDLAQIADVSERQLRVYECGRLLPRSVEFILAIALALGVPMEWLINPLRVEKLRAEIDERRETLERQRLGLDDSNGDYDE